MAANGNFQPSQLQGNGILQGQDQAHTQNVVNHLNEALARVNDPELRTSLSTALAALHKHIAARQKEHENMLAGKLSPRLMREAHGLAQQAHGVLPHFQGHGMLPLHVAGPMHPNQPPHGISML